MLVRCCSKAFTVGPLTPARTGKTHEMGSLLPPQTQPIRYVSRNRTRQGHERPGDRMQLTI